MICMVQKSKANINAILNNVRLKCLLGRRLQTIGNDNKGCCFILAIRFTINL